MRAVGVGEGEGLFDQVNRSRVVYHVSVFYGGTAGGHRGDFSYQFFWLDSLFKNQFFKLDYAALPQGVERAESPSRVARPLAFKTVALQFVRDGSHVLVVGLAFKLDFFRN